MRKILSYLLMALFSVGMWAANSYWYAGNTNGYASSPMTPSEKGNYEYISLPKQGATISFKIQLASGSWDGALGRAYNVSGFAATDVTNMNSGTSAWAENTGDSWENSCIYYVDKAFYIIVFKPKSDMNTTDNPIICASTFLPEEKDEPVEIVHTVGIKGAWDSWATTPLMEIATDKKTASIVLAMTEGVYEFGLELDYGWIANGATVTRAENTQVIPGSGSNMKLTVDADGDYTFTWTFETNTLTVTYPDVVVIPAKYYLTGDSALVVDAGYDKAKAWSPSAIKVTEDTYVLSGLKAGQVYKLKATLNGEWETVKSYADLSAVAPGITKDGDDNIVFKMATDGNVTVTLKDKVFTVEGDFAMPTVAFAGNVTKWSQVPMEVAKDKLSASVTLKELAVGVDSFKIVLDGNWISKNGEGESFYTFHRGWNEDKDIKGGNRNMILDRDNAGDYTFTWVFANDSLHIDFPAAPDTVAIYFVNTNKDWTEKIYAHAFVGAKGYKEWPGVEMTNTGEKVWEKAIYSAKVPVTYSSVIFNNGEAQTATYAWTKAKPYFCDGTWYANKESIPEIEPAKYYISGNAALVAYAGLDAESAWDGKAIKVTKDTFVFENLPAGYYLMKVATKDVEQQWIGYDRLTEKSKGLADVEDHKVGFTMEKAGNVMVVYTDKAFVVKGDYAKLPKVGLGANFNGWNWAENLLVPAEDSLSASLKVNLGVTDTIRLKIVSDGNWLSLNGAEDTEYQIHRACPKAEHVNIINDGYNFALTTDKEGDYIFTWTYADSTLNVTFPSLESSAVTVTAPAHGKITVMNGEAAIGVTVEEGTELTVTAAANDPAVYEIKNLRAYKTGEETVEVAITDGKLIMPAYPITIIADEEKIVYQTIYFVNYEDWETVKAFVWFESTAYKDWSGEPMKKEATQVKGKDLYSYTFPSKYKKIIFNNGKDGDENKTSDQSWDADKPYYCNGTWYATAEDVQLDPTVKYYITGNDDLMGPGCGWVDSKAFKSVEDAYVLKDLDPGVIYIMKVLVDGTGATTKNYLDLTSKEGLTTNEYNDIVFVLAEQGDVTVTYNATTFTVTGNFAQKEYYIAGTFTNWEANMVKMTEKDGNYSATIEITDIAENPQFKVVYVYGPLVWYGLENYAEMTSSDCTNWEIGGGEANIGIEPTKAGNYTFLFNLKDMLLTVEMPAQGGGTALDNIEAAEKAQKVIIDGQPYILFKERMYNIQGQTVK